LNTVRCDVLVIGAGPAGAAAAITLASAGIDVALADQADSPRDKTCGDALILDALAALGRLGLLDAVRLRAAAAERIQVFAPDGSDIVLDSEVCCLPRRSLDALLVERARRLGARWMAPLRMTQLIQRADLVAGAHFEGPVGGRSVGARVTLLATGAAAHPLELAGLCVRRAASGFAVRQYVRNVRLAEQVRTPVISYDQRIRPGYGWIFPCPDAVFNVGAGVFQGHESACRDHSVRRVFDRFVDSFPLARRLLSEATVLGPLKGAPLRTALKGTRFGRPGLLAIGEAAGSTYSFSGEGIGKALETGVLAGQLVVQRLRDGGGVDGLEQAYSAQLESTYRARFLAYETAQRWLGIPSFCNWLAERARRSARVRSRLEAVIRETSDPTELFSLGGVARVFVPWVDRR
jgi:flavin-dependent dehydrogenase